ncbi:MAG: DUF3108 domain-containing protein [Pseudopedobacter saltans]|uniref:DUF3108 domain-containing protein n=1 Tax=Pseudopedobacter saltans TaxID=151895 RepID=A0A2W5GTJ6_9SPHI|nr:MAG: DUF3108 domain-containing protein [Pseudopedobacter saltans]
MRKSLLTFAIAVFTLFQVSAQTDLKICGVTNNSFVNGESITFNIFYSVMGLYVNAGTANFKTTEETLNGANVYHTVGTGWTNSKYDWIFKVRDRYESYYDRSTMLPIKFIRNVNEGKYQRSQTAVFDHTNGNVLTQANKNITVPKCSFDIISALFNIRSVDFDKLAVNSKVVFDMYLDDEVYHMYLKYLGKETVETKLGTFKAIKVKPLLIKGNAFKGGEKMTAWISDDPNHIPVRIESDLSVGSIKVDLMQYSNLKTTLSSRLK